MERIMSKEEAWYKLMKIIDQFGNLRVPRLQTPGHVTTADMVDLKHYLLPIAKALEPKHCLVKNNDNCFKKIYKNYKENSQIIHYDKNKNVLVAKLTKPKLFKKFVDISKDNKKEK